MLNAISSDAGNPTSWDKVVSNSRMLMRDALHVMQTLQAEQLVFKSNFTDPNGGGAMYYKSPNLETEYEPALIPEHFYNHEPVVLINNATEPPGLKALREAHIRRTAGLRVVDGS